MKYASLNPSQLSMITASAKGICCLQDAIKEISLQLPDLSDEQNVILNQISTKLDGVASLTPEARVPSVLRVTNSGTIAPIVADLAVSNVGGADGVFLGVALKKGETLTFNAGSMNNFYVANTFTYNATGTEFIIISNRF